MAVKVSIIYYSSTGTCYEIAQAMERAAVAAGAEVRVRKVRELAPDEAIASNQGWNAHVAATEHVQEASPDDVTWADAVVFGSPTRFGNVSAQLKQFLDTLGPQWAQGALADKIYSGFTSASTAHGGHESTLLALYATINHFGGITVAPGYTDPSKFADGNPYGTSHTAGNGDQPVGDVTRHAAAVQIERVVRLAARLTAA